MELEQTEMDLMLSRILKRLDAKIVSNGTMEDMKAEISKFKKEAEHWKGIAEDRHKLLIAMTPKNDIDQL